MEAATENNDGDMPWGTRQLTIGGNLFTLEGFQFENSSKEVLQYDHRGKPKKGLALSDFDRGSANCQIEVEGTVPQRQQTFQTEDPEGDLTTYRILSRNFVEVGGASPAAKMVNITFIKKYN